MTPDTVTVAPMSVSMSEKPLSLAIVEDLAIAIHRNEDGFRAVRHAYVRDGGRRGLRNLRQRISAVVAVCRPVRPELEQVQRRTAVVHKAVGFVQPLDRPIVGRGRIERWVRDRIWIICF